MAFEGAEAALSHVSGGNDEMERRRHRLFSYAGAPKAAWLAVLALRGAPRGAAASTGSGEASG